MNNGIIDACNDRIDAAAAEVERCKARLNSCVARYRKAAAALKSAPDDILLQFGERSARELVKDAGEAFKAARAEVARFTAAREHYAAE